MVELLRSTRNFVYGTIKSWDAYKRTITFTYKGEDEFRTFFGGLITLSLYVLVLIYAAIAFARVFNRENTNVTINTSYQNLAIDREKINIDDSNFNFAFSINFMTLEELEKAGVLKNIKMEFNVFNSSIDNYESREIKLQRWSPDNLRIDNQFLETVGKSYDYWICPSFNDTFIRGSILSNDDGFIDLRIRVCETSGPNECSSSLFYLEKWQLRLVFVNSYFDKTDYKNPIKTTIEYTKLSSLQEGVSLNVDFFMKENTAELQDDYWSLTGTKNIKKFIKIDKIDRNFVSTGNYSQYNLFFQKDSESETYERKVETIFDALGNIGGIFGLLLGLGRFIVWFFTNNLFIYSIISNFYQVDSSSRYGQDNVLEKEDANEYQIEEVKEKKSEVQKIHEQLKNTINSEIQICKFVTLNELYSKMINSGDQKKAAMK